MRAIAAALALWLAANIAVAAPRGLDKPTKEAIGTDGTPGSTAYFFGAGFEPGEGFSPGPLEPQQGWSAAGTKNPFASVSTLNPFTGTQHVRLVDDPTVMDGVNRFFLSPNNPQAPNTPSTVYVRLNISNDGGANYHVFAQETSQGAITWRVVFAYTDDNAGPGTIYVLDDTGGMLGPEYVNTGVTWDHGVYRELRVDLDPAMAEQRYYYNGVLIYVGGVYGGTSVDQCGALHDCFQLPSETADYDGLSVQTLGEPSVGVQVKTWSGIKTMMR